MSTAAGAGQGTAGAGGHRRAANVVDGDGFQFPRRGKPSGAAPAAVQPGRAAGTSADGGLTWAERARIARAGSGGDGGGAASAEAAPGTVRQAERPSKVAGGGTGGGADDQGTGAVDVGGSAGQGGGDDDHDHGHDCDMDDEQHDRRAPSAAELRRQWADAAETVKFLERRGAKASELVLAQARADRDDLERRWRAAKPIHPLAKRLRWAAQELESALTKQEANRAELDRFEEWAVRRRAELTARAEADAARTAKKQKILDDLRAESGHSPLLKDGGRIMEEIRRMQPTVWATRTALRGINDDVGPAMEAALEALPEGSQAWMELHGALSSITNVQGILADALDSAASRADEYDMAAGDGDGDEGGEYDSLDGVSLPGEANAGDMHDVELHGTQRDGGTRGAGGGPTSCSAHGGSSRWAKPRGGSEGAWQRLSWADEQAAEAKERGTDDEVAKERQRAEAAAKELAEQQARIQDAARRRAEEEADERRRLVQALTPEQRAQAEALHAQQAAAASVQFGSAAATEIARQAHCKRVAEVVKAAREKDILVNQEELMQGTPEELADWAQRHI